MTNFDTVHLLKIASDAAYAAGNLLKFYKADIIISSGKDIKISADIEAHRVILEVLEKTGIPVLSEEDATHHFNKDLQWVVDPLDGSINFLKGIPFCAVSIALVKDGEPILGVVYDLDREDLFSGIVGTGAWLNDCGISVSSTREKNDAIIMTGFPSYTDYSTKALEKYISVVQSFKKVRLIGSAALSLVYIASGKADVYYEKDIKIWDVAAGLALVKSAGGSYIKSEIDSEGKCTVVAGNMDSIIEGI